MYLLEDTSSLTLLTLAAAILIEQDQKNSRLSWKQHNLTIEGRRRRDRRYPRSAIKPYSKSPFVYLLNSRNDQALLNATGVDFDEFNQLLIQFQPVFDSFTVDESTGKIVAKTRYNKGRKRSIDAKGALGLVLMWYRTKGPCNRTLPLVFGLTFTSMMKWLLFAKKCLFVALRDYAPRMPSVTKVQQYMEAIGKRYPHVASVAFAADGMKLSIEAPAHDLKQNKFYNGWKHGHFITNVFVFAADGTIPLCALNAPGCLHDSTIADYGGIYDKLQQIFEECGAMTVIDSAFSLQMADCFLKSSQSDPIGNPEAYMKNRQATSVRQLAEWGMHQLQSKFPRMTDKIKYEEKNVRQLDLSLMIRLYNHQALRLGMNQILDTCMKQSSAERSYFNYGAIETTADGFLVNNG
jgi:DDE superfamily endonuclease